MQASSCFWLYSDPLLVLLLCQWSTPLLYQEGPAEGWGGGGGAGGAGGGLLLPFLLSLRAREIDDWMGKALTVRA